MSDAVPLVEIFAAVTSKSHLARVIGVTPQALDNWKSVPPKRVLAVEEATGIPRWRIRPDLYPKPHIAA